VRAKEKERIKTHEESYIVVVRGAKPEGENKIKNKK
jgi:hypothetical protein